MWGAAHQWVARLFFVKGDPVSEKNCQMLGLVGFIVAGVLFVIVGLRDGDWMVTVASLIWILPVSSG